MARTKYVSTQVDEGTWKGIIDAGNLWGDSISMATFKLVQRGLMSLDTELGSKTPAHVKVARIRQTLNSKMDTKQGIAESRRLADELGDEKTLEDIKKLAKELGIDF